MPTAFTGYSFHVLEAIIVFFNEILVCFFLPIHTRVHRYYHMYTTVIHQRLFQKVRLPLKIQITAVLFPKVLHDEPRYVPHVLIL